MPDAVLLTTAGVHEPVIAGELLEVIGKIGAGVPIQIGARLLNSGVILLVTVTFMIVGIAH